MTLQFIGTLRYRFRLSLFGYDLYVGPWIMQAVNLNEPVPASSTSINLPDGFSIGLIEAATGASIRLVWEGLPILSDTIPIGGSLPISVQPLKGIILSGTASLVS